MNTPQIVMMKTADLIPYENNPRKNDDAAQYVANSIKEFGFKVPIVIDKENVIVAGHTRLKAAESLGIDEVPCIVANDLTEAQIKAFRLADNKTGEFAEWDFDALDMELEELADIDFDMEQFGFEFPENDNNPDDKDSGVVGSLAEKYLVPPFSVIYANKPDWLARKRQWVEMGLHSEIGRGGDLLLIQGAIQRQTSYQGGGQNRAKPSKTIRASTAYQKEQGICRRANRKT